MVLGCRRSGYEEGTAVAEQPNTVDVGPHPDGGKQYGLDRNRGKPVGRIGTLSKVVASLWQY